MFTTEIIYLVAASILAYGHCSCVPFTCIDEKHVLIMNFPMTCQNDLVCNQDKLSCEPCIVKPKPCPFTCAGNAVNFTGHVIDCDDPFVCNPKPKSDCKSCMRPKCNPEMMQFKCDEDGDDDTLVIIGKYKVHCYNGYKCNSEFLQPCEPCISRDDNLRQPFVQPTNTSWSKIDELDGIEISDEEMINCNDGKSFLQPCRPGADGANYYFKCTLSWNLRYSTSIKPCTSLYGDKHCRRVQGLCLP